MSVLSYAYTCNYLCESDKYRECKCLRIIYILCIFHVHRDNYMYNILNK